MTDFQRRVLLAIRALGPCSVNDVRRMARLWREHQENCVYRNIYELRKKGFVKRIRRSKYDLTNRGFEAARAELEQTRLCP